VVAGVAFNMDCQWEPVTQRLSSLAPTRHYEFKGAKFFRQLRNGHKRERADALFRAALQVIPDYELIVFHGACDREGLQRLGDRWEGAIWPSLDLAFNACLTAASDAFRTFAHKEKLLWIHDNNERKEKQLKVRLEEFKEFAQMDKSNFTPESLRDHPM